MVGKAGRLEAELVLAKQIWAFEAEKMKEFEAREAELKKENQTLAKGMYLD